MTCKTKFIRQQKFVADDHKLSPKPIKYYYVQQEKLPAWQKTMNEEFTI